jgi:hypothetical protein
MDLFNEDGPLKTVPAQLRLPHGREKVHRPAIVSRVCVGLFRRHTRPGTCEPQKHAKDPPDSHGMLVRGSLVLVCPHRTSIRVVAGRFVWSNTQHFGSCTPPYSS